MTVLCVVLAAAGHAAAGGPLPSVAALLAVGAPLGAAFVIMADRERGLGSIMLAAVGSQLLFHLAFEITAHDHAAVGASGQGFSSAVLPADRMLMAHLAAAGLMGVLARYGDSLVWGMAGLLGFTRIPSLLLVPIDRRPPTPRLPVLRTRPRSRVEIRIRPRRGPPIVGVPARRLSFPSSTRTRGLLRMSRTPVSARRPGRAFGRLGVVGVVAGTALLATGPAYAHVTVDPGEAEQGGYATLAFRVPNESERAGTTRLQVELPTDTPISSVRTQPKSGWEVEVRTEQLDEPVDVGGIDVEEAVTRITWTAEDGVAIGPDEFEEFRISAGPLPAGVESLELPATQTYDDGEVVKWHQPTGEDGTEPAHPAPVLALVEPTDGGHGHGSGPVSDSAAEHATDQPTASGSSDPAVDGTARTLGGVGTAVGLLGLLVGAGAILSARRTAAAAGGSNGALGDTSETRTKE